MATPYPGQDPQQPHQPAYPGSQPYGTPAYGPPSGYPQPGYGRPYSPDIRPATVTVAAWITIVLSALSVLAGLGAVLGGSALVEYMRDHPDEAGLSAADLRNLDDAKLGFAAAGVVLIFFSLVAIAVAVLVLKRHNWARVTLVVLAGITAVAGLAGTVTALFGALWLIGAIAVIVCLFAGGANAWFRRSSGSSWDDRQAPPPYGPGSYPPPYQQPPVQQPPYQQGPYPPQ